MTRSTFTARTVAGYRLEEVLGEGASGVVYRAKDPKGKLVALKLLREDSRDRIEVTKRFRREAEVHRQLVHPNLVIVHEVGVCDDGPFIAMELVAGGSLAARLAEGGAMDSERVRAAGAALASGLAYLHEKGVKHRDVKPSNILLGERGTVKLADFGLARQDTSTLLTTEKSLLGTLAYIPPEVLEGGDPSPGADVYSLGLVLIEMLTGQPVIAPGEVEGMIRRITRDPIRSPRELGVENVGEELEALIMRMVARDPADRPGTADAAARLAALAPAPDTPPRSAPRSGPRSAAGPRSHPAPPPTPPPTLALEVGERLPRWALHAILVISVTLGLALSLRSPTSRPAPDSSGDASAAATAASASPPETGAPDEIRAELAGIDALLDRYDRGCPVIPGDTTETRVRAMFLGDTFFRSRLGDVSLLFTALSRLASVIERGDQARLEDPVWLETARTGLDLMEEVARSNGFDTGSKLGRPLARVEEALGSQPGTFRVDLGNVLHSSFRYYRSLAVKQYLDHIDIHGVVLDHLELTPLAWQTRPEGRVTRITFFRRAMLQSELVMTMEPESRLAGHRQRIQELCRRAMQDIQRDRELLTADLGPGTGMARWAICQIMGYGMRFLQEDSAGLATSIELYNVIAPGLQLGDARPRWRSEATRTLFIIEKVRTLRPQLGVLPGPRASP